jgi:cytochrome c
MKTIIAGLVLAALAGASVAPAQAAGDPAAGANVFKRCTSCHSIGDGAQNKTGPVLNGVVGRVAGTYEGYQYSDALVKAGQTGLTWTPDQLAEWLSNPRAKVPGTKMAFSGLKNQADLDNVIAYLESFSPDFVPPAQ